jgi:hypothetical protein
MFVEQLKMAALILVAVAVGFILHMVQHHQNQFVLT